MEHHWNNYEINKGWITYIYPSFFYFFFFTFFVSCKAQNENFPLVCFKDSIIPTKIYTWNFTVDNFWFNNIQKVNNDTILFINPIHSNKIFLLNFNQTNYDSIVLATIPKNYSLDIIHFVDFVSNDSINVFLNLRGTQCVDFKILTINRKGQIKHIKEPIKKSKQIKYYYVSPSDYEVRNGCFAFFYSENITHENYFDLSKRKLCIYNLKKDSIISVSLDFPEINSSTLKNLDNDYFYPSLNWINDSTILISFRFTNKIIKYNILQNKYEVIMLSVFYISTDLGAIHSVGTYKGIYWGVKYYPSLKIYTRRIGLDYEYKKKNLNFYYDEHFNLIGINYEPRKFYWEKLNNVYNFSSLNGKLQLLKFDNLTFDTCYKSYIDSMMYKIKINQQMFIACTKNAKTEKEKLEKLVEIISSKITYNDYQILILSSSGCPSCVEFMFKLLQSNKKLFSKNPPLIILYIGEIEQYKEYFSELDNFKNSFIIDKEGNYELFFNSMNINPLILTVKNKTLNKITPFDAVEKENSRFIKELFYYKKK